MGYQNAIPSKNFARGRPPYSFLVLVLGLGLDSALRKLGEGTAEGLDLGPS